MPRVPVHTLETAPPESVEGLKAVKDRYGVIPNIHAEMAHAAVVLNAYLALHRVIQDDGTLDARTREAIALTVAAVDACSYCEAAHTLSATAAGLTREQTIAIRTGKVDFDEKLAALLSVVREATANAGNVAPMTWHAALDAGWTDAELAEAHVHVVANLFTNYFNHLVGTELDLPPAPALDET